MCDQRTSYDVFDSEGGPTGLTAQYIHIYFCPRLTRMDLPRLRTEVEPPRDENNRMSITQDNFFRVVLVLWLSAESKSLSLRVGLNPGPHFASKLGVQCDIHHTTELTLELSSFCL